MILRIQEVMDHYGLSVSAFADRLGVQRSSISHLLNGRNRPSLDFVMKLIGAYPEVDLYWLLKGEGGFPKKENGSAPEAPGMEPAPVEVPKPARSTPLGGKNTSREPSGEPVDIVVLYGDGTFKTFKRKKD